MPIRFLGISIASRGRSRLDHAGAGPGQGNAEPQTAAPARRSRKPEAASQGSVRAGADARRSSGALNRLLLPRLSCRSESAACRRPILASYAPVAQSHVGKSGDDRLPRALFAQGEGRRRLERHSGRGHFPAARRPNADGPCVPSGRPRRRCLADADAGPHALEGRTRDHVGRRHGERGWALGHGALDAGAGRNHQGGGRGAAGRTHLRKRRDQESPVRDREWPALDEQGARLLGAQLPFPYSHQVPGG